MHETSKSIFHKITDSRYATRYLVGDGIDIGAGSDSLALYSDFFPLMKSCRPWDIADGDAELMLGVESSTYDFVHSSHCLEHMRNAHNALDNWVRVLKPGGYLVCIVPDEDLYEQGVFPSTFNGDHKHTFTIYKRKSWTIHSINVFDLLSNLKDEIEVKKIELLDATYRYDLNERLNQKRYDQTLTPIGECGIEFVVRKLGGVHKSS
jgi:SAM-dependent methyltransferase